MQVSPIVNSGRRAARVAVEREIELAPALDAARRILQELLNCPYDLVAQNDARDWLRRFKS